jgi:hypothetical protein
VATEGQFRVGGSTELEYGDATELERAQQVATNQEAPAPPEIGPAVEQGSPALDFPVDAGGPVDPDLDAVLYGPTDYPDRPLTNGMGFGTGSNFSPNPQETEDQFMHRVAIKVLDAPGPEELKVWAARRLAGA